MGQPIIENYDENTKLHYKEECFRPWLKQFKDVWRLRNLYSDFIILKDDIYYLVETKQCLKRQNIYEAIVEILSAEQELYRLFCNDIHFPKNVKFKRIIACKSECCLKNATYVKTLKLWNIEVWKIPKEKKVVKNDK